MTSHTKPVLTDLHVTGSERLSGGYHLLRLRDNNAPLPDMLPGQFVELRVDGAQHTFLRRPISIHDVDGDRGELLLLIHIVGEGTRCLSGLAVGDSVNCLFPLGRGFTVPEQAGEDVLLVGGGVGVAPLLYYGRALCAAGCRPTFLLGGRTAADVLRVEAFAEVGEVHITTDDGSAGTRGFVTQHSLWVERKFSRIAACGPKPMMKAVARLAHANATPCEVSLENLMACGLGACLCCVEKDGAGHNVCVCREGPVFDISRLGWD